jgi:hypothetical protein
MPKIPNCTFAKCTILLDCTVGLIKTVVAISLCSGLLDLVIPLGKLDKYQYNERFGSRNHRYWWQASNNGQG